MYKKDYTFQVLVHGTPVREHPHQGLVYIEGRTDSNFTLRVQNNTSERVLAVITVDGLSVMNGRQGSYDSGGYVIGPHSSVNIPGWRLDNDAVARFFFANYEQSYAAQMDRPTNIGVIGCAIFREMTFSPPVTYKIPYGEPPHTRGDEYPALEGSTESFMPNIGTGFGDRTKHHVTEVNFRRQTGPSHTFEIFYDDRNGLTAKGVNLKPQVAILKPVAFPKEEENQGCSPPPGWRQQ